MIDAAAICPACCGSGRAWRQGREALAGLHPVLARLKGLCERCGGAGVAPVGEGESSERLGVTPLIQPRVRLGDASPTPCPLPPMGGEGKVRGEAPATGGER